MKIRRAKLRDVEQMSQIACSCYERYEHTDSWSPIVIAEVKEQRGANEHIRAIVLNQTAFVAEKNGAVVGMVSIHKNEVTKLFVDPGHHRCGVGTALFGKAEEHISSTSHETMFLGAAAPTAVPFYLKMGMTITDQRQIDCGPCIGMTSTLLAKALA